VAAVLMVLADMDSVLPLAISLSLVAVALFCYSVIFLIFRVARQVTLPLSVRKWTWFLVRRVTVPTRSFSSVQGMSSGQLVGRLILFVILTRSPAFRLSTLTVGGSARSFGGARSLSRRATLTLSFFISFVSSSMSVFIHSISLSIVFVLKQCCTYVRSTVARQSSNYAPIAINDYTY
jgi:hypothetical protein